MTRKMLKIFFISIFVLVAVTAALVWRMNSNDSCLMYGTTYTPIKTILIENKKYYLYTSISGMQDKLNIISMSPVELPETICDYSAIKTPIYSIDFDKNKIIEKLLITKKSATDFFLEPIYSTVIESGSSQNLDGLKIEIKQPTN